MKTFFSRLISLTLVLVCLCGVCFAAATTISREEWNAQCPYKLSKEATVYAAIGDKSGEKLGKGTYVMIVGEIEGWRLIKHYNGGTPTVGWVKDSVVMTIQGQPVNATAAPTPVPTPEPNQPLYTAAVNRTSNVYADTSLSSDVLFALEEGVSIGVIKLGTVWSSVVENGQVGMIPTCALTLTEEEQPYGYVVTGRSGEVSLRRTAADDGKVIVKLREGTVVLVLGKENNYFHVQYGNTEGYVAAAYLHTLCAVEPGNTAVVINPNTPGKAISVNMRSKADSDAVVVSMVPTDTMVQVVAVCGDWCEIEVDGLHGFMQSRFLQ